MADIDFLEPLASELILATHSVVQSRATGNAGVVNGNKISATAPVSMYIAVDAGRIRINGAPLDVEAQQKAIVASDPALDRIDIIIRDENGDVQSIPGSDGGKNDPKGLGNWHQYDSPVPIDNIDSGVILGAVYIAAGVTAISDADIWMFAGRVPDIKTSVALPGSDAVSLSEHASNIAYAPVAKGVTNGDSHDHYQGDGAQIDHTKLSNIGTNAHSAIDTFIGTKAQANGLASLDGSSKAVQDPANATATPTASKIPIAGGDGKLAVGWIPTTYSVWTAETNFTATPASTSTLTMTADLTATILVGCGLKYTIGGTVYYGIVTAITANLLTIAGAPLSGSVAALSWSDPTRVVQVDFFIPGTFADAANTGLLASDARTKFDWNLTKAYLVQIRHTVRIDDSGANQPQVTVSVNTAVVGTDNTNAGLAVAETWVSTVVGINTSNYDINRDEAIEIVTDASGSNDDAQDLTVSVVFVVP